MGRVQVRITASLASIVNAEGSGSSVLEKDIVAGATLRDLLADLAVSYPDFRKAVFNTEAGTVSDEVLFVLNDNLLQGSDVTKVKLNDGDIVMLLPKYAGG